MIQYATGTKLLTHKSKMTTQYFKKLENKKILITGGTGSFGNAVVKKLFKFNPQTIRIFSRDETKQFDMRNKYKNDKRLEFFIGDVRNKESVSLAMRDIDLVFNAAALKHVPPCEFFPLEAVKTNVIGTSNVINKAIEHKVQHLVVLSTDKAVYPINAMGQSKALMEKIMIANSRRKDKKTVLCGVRYGNVMCSRGSVIPFFMEQIRQKEPLTLTNGNMTRFLLKMDDAIDLILYALINGEDGNIFVKKAPAATIRTIAEALSVIFNHKSGIKEIGIRPGEKIHETLISREEFFRAEDKGDYYKIEPETKSLDYEKYFSKGKKSQNIYNEGYTSENTMRLNLEQTIELLVSLDEIKDFNFNLERYVGSKNPTFQSIHARISNRRVEKSPV